MFVSVRVSVRESVSHRSLSYHTTYKHLTHPYATAYKQPTTNTKITKIEEQISKKSIETKNTAGNSLQTRFPCILREPKFKTVFNRNIAKHKLNSFKNDTGNSKNKTLTVGIPL